jgi:hypothetical protein
MSDEPDVILPDPRRRRLVSGALLGVGALLGSPLAHAQYGRESQPPKPAPATAQPGASHPVPSAAPAEPLPSSEIRLALLLGNRSYPQPFDLPPIPKNLRDLEGALARRGFKVTTALDLDLPSARRALDTFVAEAANSPPDATIFFYFGGHGIQVDAANLLLPAGLNPSARADVLQTASVQLLSDVVRRLPPRREGMVIAVVDACRTGLRAGEVAGLNQVEAPPGCLISFSTAAGKPAIAPAVETQNTFYTGSLVKLLGSVSGETTFPELMHLVRTDVRETMLKHPVAAVRELAQDPFIADHTRVRLTVEPRRAGGAAPVVADVDEEEWLKKLEKLAWPAEVLQLCESFLQARPQSPFAPGVQVARDGARTAVTALKRSDVRLYRAAFALSDDMPREQRQDLLRCGRGDKDAAARMAARFRAFNGSSAMQSRYEGWLQFAVALGNGIASYELALHFRSTGQPLLASQFESRARDLGYTPPPDLDNVRK